MECEGLFSIAFPLQEPPLFSMETFEEFVTENKIISYLCRMRAKLAKRRNKKHLIHLLSLNPQYNYHNAKLTDLESELQKILPRRKQWKKLGEKTRQQNGQPLNSIDKNIRSLTVTIESFKRESPNEPFLLNLNKFIASIKDAISDADYSICKPVTYPKPKDKDHKKESCEICRPISIFSLKDRIIIGLTNKFITRLFDIYFYDNSLAFRAPRQKIEDKRTLTHHDAIRKIKAYLQQRNGKQLWVAECDMEKFYDTVNHSIIKCEFKKLLKKVKKDYPTLATESIQRIFYNYLDCYAFNKDIHPLNKKPDYFRQFKIAKGQFAWVKEKLLDLGYYKSISRARIGVPQGGALSGLIANIVLNKADRQVERIADKDLLYIRYCDDMLIIHPDRSECERAFNAYRDSLKTLKLIPHDCPEAPSDGSGFWNTKSKMPYRWCDEKENGYPWIGFVGYEIHYDGHVRIRKKSLKKEMEKQYEVINEVRRAVEGDNKKVTNKQIEESVINRLIGMAVGRVELWNAESIKNEMCWINGFVEVTDNKHTRIQLKRLDACRNKLYRKLQKELKKDGNAQSKGSKEQNKGKGRQLLYYGKPFSYYYQVIERRKEKE